MSETAFVLVFVGLLLGGVALVAVADLTHRRRHGGGR